MADPTMPFRPELAVESQDRARIASLLGAYWSFGQFWGVFTILLLEFQQRHSFSDGQVGLRLAALSIVAVGTMLFLAPRLGAVPLAVTVPAAIMTLAVASVALALLSTGWIWLALALVGMGNGLMDVFMNVAAQRVEARTHRPVLQWLHACYALGGVTGAALAGLLRTADVDYRVGFLLAAVALFLTAFWNSQTRLEGSAPTGEKATFSMSALFRSPALWVPAVALLGAFLVEGSMDVWSGLYLRQELGASPLAAAGAFMAFAGAAFVGRMFAGRVLFGLGRRVTILASGIGSAVAGVVAVLTHSALVVGVAFLVLGFALSAAAPAAFGLVEDIDEDPTQAIAGVTTVGYTGFIWSPPLIGWIAGAWSLRAAMAFVVSFTFAIVAAGLFVPGRRDRDPSLARAS